jgi:hypothetical protein
MAVNSETMHILRLAARDYLFVKSLPSHESINTKGNPNLKG